MIAIAGYHDNLIRQDQSCGECHARHSLAFRRTACCRDRSDVDARHL